MGLPIPAGVVFSYNGFVFPSNVRTKVKEDPVQSGDNRVVKYSKIGIHVAGYITIDDAGTIHTAKSITIASGGADYTVGDALTIDGGVSSVEATIIVVTVDGGGAITGISIISGGSYSSQLANPASASGGTGEDATFNLSFGVLSYNTLDDFMQTMRRTLQVHGKNLIYVNKGYGKDLNVNPPADIAANPNSVPPVSASIRDVAMGPKAGTLSWWPMGGAPTGCHAAGFEWEVSTCVVECEDFPQNPGPRQFLEISSTVNYDCDEAGLVTITTNGSAQIPLSLRSDLTLDRTIDDSISFVIRPPSAGFLRKHSRQISADRGSCTFAITDRQVEVPFPDDVISIDMKHRIRQERPYSPVWSCTISGTVRLSPTANKFLAERRFFNIAAQRMAFARRNATIGSGIFSSIGIGLVNRGIVLGTTEMEEDLFKNESRFTVNYRMLGARLDKVVSVSGLWRPIFTDAVPPLAEGWNAQTWSASLASNAQKFKGYLGVTYDKTKDVIIDICNGTIGPRVTVAGAFDEVVAPDDVIADEELVTDQDFYDSELTPIEIPNNEQFPPEISWVAWECTPSRIIDHHLIRHKPLMGTTSPVQSGSDPFGDVASVAADIDGPQSSWESDTPDIIQQIAHPSLKLRLVGFAVRAGYRINPPMLISYQGLDAHLDKEIVSESTMGVSSSVTMYRTDWDLTYLIAGPSDGVPVMANPVLGSDGSDASSGSPFQNPIESPPTPPIPPLQNPLG
jgi:hypothetical protein